MMHDIAVLLYCCCRKLLNELLFSDNESYSKRFICHNILLIILIIRAPKEAS